MAFKKSKQKSQPDLFATASFSLPERERKYIAGTWKTSYRGTMSSIATYC